MSTLREVSYLRHVDALRAIAVLGVILFHLDVSWLPGGYVGVDVFFVISGYLITGLLSRELLGTTRLNLAQFYLRRVRRLLPALLVMLTLTAICAVLLMSPEPLEHFGGSLVLASVGLSNFYFWHEAGYFAPEAITKPLLHTWSLGVEEQFYLLWPALLVGLSWLSARLHRRWTWLVGLSLVGALSLVGNLWMIEYGLSVQDEGFERRVLFQNAHANMFYLMPFRAFEFVIGALLVWLPANRLSQSANSLLVVVGVLMIVGAMASFAEDLWFPGYLATVPCVGTALLIYSGAHSFRPGLLANPVLVWLGLLSYSLYLYHWPILVFWEYLTLAPIGAPGKFGVVALSTVMACASYYWIERPFRQPSPSSGQGRRRTAIVVIAVLLIAWGGNVLVLSKGWSSRVESLEPLSVEYGGDRYMDVGQIGSAQQLPQVFMIGDSNAKHYAEGLNAVLAKQGVGVFLHSSASSLHLPGVFRTGAGTWRKSGPEAVADVLKRVRKLERAPLVILSQAWVYQLSHTAMLADDRPAGLGDVVAALDEFAEAIAPARLLVLGTVPTTYGIDLQDRMTRPFGPPDPETLRWSARRAPIYDVNVALAEAARQSGRYLFLDPHEILCDGSRCRNLDDQNRPLYSDPTHLNKLGSRLVVAELVRRYPHVFPSTSH